MNKNYLIIGVSAAGLSAAHKLRQIDPQATITCISDEQEFPYNKCFLADYVAGSKTIAQVHTTTPELMQEKNITLELGTAVAQIDSVARCVRLLDGREFAYDALLLATGCTPLMPALPGNTLQGVFLFNGLAHAQHIKQWIAQRGVTTAVVVGAGLSGLECADALALQGIKVCVVERARQVLARNVDEQGSAFIEECMQKTDVMFYKHESVTEFVGADGAVTHVRLASGQNLKADMVVVAIGARQNSALAAQAGATLQGTGIMVDDRLETSLPGVYAAGDVIMVKDQITGDVVPSCTWPDAMLQGLIAAQNMTGQSRNYPGVTVVTSSAFFGVKFASCGPVVNPRPYMTTFVHTGADFYHKFLLMDDVLQGFLLIGATQNLGFYRKAVLTRQKLEKSQLVSG